jgi:hypothetical protein
VLNSEAMLSERVRPSRTIAPHCSMLVSETIRFRKLRLVTINSTTPASPIGEAGVV